MQIEKSVLFSFFSLQAFACDSENESDWSFNKKNNPYEHVEAQRIGTAA